jgi:hypothetical protein
MIGLGNQFGRLGARSGGSSFARIFVGQLGGWWDPSDLTKMFQEAAGSTPAVVGQPVGLVKDKSGNGYDLSQSTSSKRPVLQQSGSLYYLQFDGIDDALTLSTGRDLFQNVTSAFVAMAVSVASVSAGQVVLTGWSVGTGQGSRATILANNTTLQAGGQAARRGRLRLGLCRLGHRGRYALRRRPPVRLHQHQRGRCVRTGCR